MIKDVQGTIYLLHFETGIQCRPNARASHARHYIGWAYNLDRRIKEHRGGYGSKLLAECKRLGINFVVVRTWRGTRTDERRLHNRKDSPRMCPICIERNRSDVL
jgi:hypothetical protein